MISPVSLFLKASAFQALAVSAVLTAGPVLPQVRLPRAQIAAATSARPQAALVQRVPDATRIPRIARASTSIISVDRAALSRFATAGGGLLERFPLGAHLDVTLSLVPVQPFTDDAVLETGRTARRPATSSKLHSDGAFLVGSVAGAPSSHAFLASSAAGTFGYVEFDGHTFIISSGAAGSGLPTASYDLTALPPGLIETPPWACGTIDPPAPPAGGSGDGSVASAAGTCRQVRMAFETDHEFYQLFAGNVTAATDYVATLSAALTSIYARDLSARLSTSYLRLWPETQDSWDAATTAAQLTQFRTVWSTQGAVARDLAHMLSGRNLGGGIAYLPGLCSTYGYGVSANLAGFFPTPLVNNATQNWDIFVVAHEIGHNFGMPHTHAMNPPVDGCGSSPQDCSAADTDSGTIMSYCHLCAGGLSNIRLEFHPASVALAETTLSGLACDYTGPARAPVAASDSVQLFRGLPALIDVLANDVQFNCESITITSFPAQSALGASITRSVGTGPGGRDQLRYSMPYSGALGADSFSYVITDASGQTATATVSGTVGTLREPENPVRTTPGLDVSYYPIGGEVILPDYDQRTPYAIGTVTDVNYPLTFNSFATSGRSDFVGARFQGWITVPQGGLWTLYAASDEGSRLSIGSSVVVDNDGVHGYAEQSGAIALAAGTHPVKVDYFERTGTCGLVLSWRGPDGVKAVVPASQFTRGGSNTPEDLTNDGRVDALDIAVLLANWGSLNSPYDLTGDGLIGGADLTMVLFAWTG